MGLSAPQGAVVHCLRTIDLNGAKGEAIAHVFVETNVSKLVVKSEFHFRLSRVFSLPPRLFSCGTAVPLPNVVTVVSCFSFSFVVLVGK